MLCGDSRVGLARNLGKPCSEGHAACMVWIFSDFFWQCGQCDEVLVQMWRFISVIRFQSDTFCAITALVDTPVLWDFGQYWHLKKCSPESSLPKWNTGRFHNQPRSFPMCIYCCSRLFNELLCSTRIRLSCYRTRNDSQGVRKRSRNFPEPIRGSIGL